MTEPLILSLPWSESVNHYWYTSGNRRYLSAKALEYRKIVWATFKEAKHPGFGHEPRLKVHVLAYPKDRRRTDLDNRLKGLFDSLQHAGIFADDFQIDEIHMVRMPEIKGKLIVEVSCL